MPAKKRKAAEKPKTKEPYNFKSFEGWPQKETSRTQKRPGRKRNETRQGA